MNTNNIKESRLAIERFLSMSSESPEFEGTDFCNNLNHNLKSIIDAKTLARISINKQDAAVLVPIEQFKFIEHIIANFSALLDEKEFNTLWAALNSQVDESDYPHRNVSDTELNMKFIK